MKRLLDWFSLVMFVSIFLALMVMASIGFAVGSLVRWVKRQAKWLVGTGLVLGMVLGYSPNACAQENPAYYKAVVDQLSDMFQAPHPAKIQVDVLTQEELQKWYHQEQMKICMAGWMGDLGRRVYCVQVVDNIRVFIKGRWIPEDDKTFFHVMLSKKAGLETLTHEWLHYHLFYSTEPNGIVNDHAIILPMVVSVMTSEEFVKFLEELDEGGN